MGVFWLVEGGEIADHPTGEALMVFPRETATHLALSALSSWTDAHPGKKPTTDGLEEVVKRIVGADVELPSEVEEAIGEV